MSPIATKEQIIEATRKGVEKAHSDYRRISGGDWLNNAPEYFITTRIADSIAAIPSLLVTMESNVKGTLQWAGTAKKGRPKKNLRKGGRFDIVVYYGNGNPKSVIEVKNRVYSYSDTIQDDILRIKSVLEDCQHTSINFGIFTFFTSAAPSNSNNADAIIEQRMKTLKRRINETLAIDSKGNSCSFNLQMHTSEDIKVEPVTIWQGDGSWNREKHAWQACCCVITPQFS